MSDPSKLAEYAVSARAESETKTVVEARDFEFVVDEPPTIGGTDDGPNPVEYLLGAWAGCLNVVAHIVADERDIVLDALDVELSGGLDPRKFRGQSEEVRAGYQSIDVALEVETDADDAALDAWLAEVERRCPVGDNITRETPATVRVERR